MVKRRQKDFLRDVFGIVFVSDQVACEAEDRLTILLHQLPEVARLPGKHLDYDLIFAYQ